MVKCEHMRGLLSPYIDGMCSHREKEVLEEHLAQCPECQQELESLKFICTYLSMVSAPPVPEGLVQEIHDRVQAEKIYQFKRPVVAQPRRGGIVAVVAAAALSLGLFVSSYLPSTAISVAVDKWLSPPQESNEIDIAEILKNYEVGGSQQGVQQPDTDPGIAIADNSEGEEPSLLGGTGDSNQGGGAVDPVAIDPVEVGPAPMVEVQPQIVHQYAAKTRVADVGVAVQSIYAMSDTFGLNPVLSPTGSAMMSDQEDIAKTRLVYLDVPATDVDAVLAQLTTMGFSVPELSVTDMTADYEQVISSLTTTDRVLQQTEQDSGLTPEQRNALEAYKEQLLQQKSEIEHKANEVKLKLYVMELQQ